MVMPFSPNTAITFVTSVVIVPLLFLYVPVVVVAAVGVCVGASEKLSIVTWLWLYALLVVVLSISCCALVLWSRSPLLDVCLFCVFFFFYGYIVFVDPSTSGLLRVRCLVAPFALRFR